MHAAHPTHIIVPTTPTQEKEKEKTKRKKTNLLFFTTQPPPHHFQINHSAPAHPWPDSSGASRRPDMNVRATWPLPPRPPTPPTPPSIQRHPR